MTIDDLKELIAPPDKLIYPGSRAAWDAFQKKIGLQFPVDYFTIVQTYGSGRFIGGEFKVANPFDPDDERFADIELTRLRETKASAPREVPFPLFPEPSGLYPFGIDGNGNTFLWVTAGDGDKWPIACFNSEEYSEVASHRLIEFMVLLSSNKLKINRRKFWGSDFTKDQLEFVPRKLPARKRKPRGR